MRPLKLSLLRHLHKGRLHLLVSNRSRPSSKEELNSDIQVNLLLFMLLRSSNFQCVFTLMGDDSQRSDQRRCDETDYIGGALSGTAIEDVFEVTCTVVDVLDRWYKDTESRDKLMESVTGDVILWSGLDGTFTHKDVVDTWNFAGARCDVMRVLDMWLGWISITGMASLNSQDLCQISKSCGLDLVSMSDWESTDSLL
ncbi:hypothetical protein Tco_0809531 [Tanacetum coccineum]